MDINRFSAYPVDIYFMTVAISWWRHLGRAVTVRTASQLWSSMLRRLNLVNVDDVCVR